MKSLSRGFILWTVMGLIFFWSTFYLFLMHEVLSFKRSMKIFQNRVTLSHDIRNEIEFWIIHQSNDVLAQCKINVCDIILGTDFLFAQLKYLGRFHDVVGGYEQRVDHWLLYVHHRLSSDDFRVRFANFVSENSEEEKKIILTSKILSWQTMPKLRS